MKVFIKFFLLVTAVFCIFIGFDKINHTYEIAEQSYDEYISDLHDSEDAEDVFVPSMAEKYYVSTSIKETIIIYGCILIFGMLLLLVLIIDFVKWVNTWEKEKE